MREIDELVVSEFDGVLYHYTSIDSLLGIAANEQFWASNIYFLNDSSEIIDAIRFVSREATIILKALEDEEAVVVGQLVDWLKSLKSPQGIFVVSLSESSNELSQWRSYTPFGKGICLGIGPARLRGIVRSNAARLVRCVYSDEDKSRLSERIVQKTLESFHARMYVPPEGSHAPTRYHGLFELLKEQFLTVFASFKNYSFGVEREWRIVSRHIPHCADYEYRSGASILVPYVRMSLVRDPYLFDELVLGPTEHNNLSMWALASFMSKFNLSRSGCAASTIPYREWRR